MHLVLNHSLTSCVLVKKNYFLNACDVVYRDLLRFEINLIIF